MHDAIAPGHPVLGMTYRLVQFYTRFFHKLTVQGREHIPSREEQRKSPLIVVSNHTAGLDPFLIQAACPFHIIWLMARDMMDPRFSPLWEHLNIISVDRTSKREMASVRMALRRLEEGEAVGIFPEGGIERPSRHLLTFKSGAGLIISRGKARVLPVFIENTPDVPQAWQSLVIPSSPRITFGPIMTFESGTKPDEISKRLQVWFEDQSQWPVLTRPQEV